MNRENYFLLLGLSYDPIENDSKVIADTIIKFKREWNKYINHPTKQITAKKYLSYIKDIENTMNNATLRENEANDAKRIAYEKLDRDLALICSKGSITSEEVAALMKEHNISKRIIEKRLTVPIKDGVKKNEEVQKGLDVSVVKKIQHNLNILSKENLYDFLEVTINTSVDIIIQKARYINAEANKNTNKTAEITATGELAGICIDIFQSKDKIKQYAITMVELKLKQIDEMINTCAKITKRLENTQFLYIVNYAGSLGIDKVTAEKRIIDYCKQKGIMVDYSSSSGDKSTINRIKKCGVCGMSNVITDKSIKMCSGCGSPLRIKCPKCNTENDSSSHACTSCGHIIGNMPNAIKCIENAKNALKSYRIKEADKYLKEAEEYWPGHKDIANVKIEINKLKVILQDNIDLLDKAISEKCFYKANEEFSNIIKKFSGYKDDKVKIEIEEAIDSAEKLVVKATTSTNELEIIDLCIKALNICSDCKKAKTILEKYPPEAPSNLKISKVENNILLKWDQSSSKGDIHYRIVKKVGSIPNNIFDGEYIDNIRSNYYEDNNIRNGVNYYFAIYAVRGGINSKALVNSNAITRLEEVSEVEIIPGDSVITINWNIPDNCDEVEVFKYENNTVGAKVNSVFNGGMKEEGLINNNKYTYYIRTKYISNNQISYSKGIVVDSTPKEPAKPLIDYEVINENNRYKITWLNSLGNNFNFYYSESYIPFSTGSMERRKDIENKLTPISVISKGADNLIFNINNLKLFYIVPVTFSEDIAIIGKQKKISNVKDVLNLNYKFNTVLEQVELEWKWPSNINEVLVTYNNLGFKEDPDDDSIIKEIWSKERYEQNNSCIIRNIGAGNYYFTIYGIERENGRISYSAGENIKVIGNSISYINYEVKTDKGLFGGVKGATISISTDKDITEIPGIVIVGKMRTLPINKKDGEIIDKIDLIEMNKGRNKLKLPKDSLKNGMYIRVFFNDENENKNYRLFSKSKNQII